MPVGRIQSGREARGRISLAPAILAPLLGLAALHPAPAAQAGPHKASQSAQSNLSRRARDAASAGQRGDTSGAIAAYEKLVQADPRSAEYQFQLGKAYYAAGHAAQAVEPLEKALKLKPGLAEARDFLSASEAESGRCGEALPGLKQAAHHVTDQRFARTLGLDGVRCAMELDAEDDALAFLGRLRRQFPKDPEVLYVAVHAYSDLSTRASQKLLNTDPGSYQVHELYAESLESRGKWDEAAKEYRKVLAMNPNLPGIHYLLGRLILSEPKTAATFDEAQKEFEAELKVDPHNAGAEFVLGELALRTQDWKAAIGHFSAAVKDDPHFVDAQIELGKTLITSNQPAQAIAPLEAAVKLQPDNPAPHYLLSTAYRRVGRAQDANRELAAFQKAQQKAQENTQNIRSAVTGRKTPAQTGGPPKP